MFFCQFALFGATQIANVFFMFGGFADQERNVTGKPVDHKWHFDYPAAFTAFWSLGHSILNKS
jgi:hypothetical protein